MCRIKTAPSNASLSTFLHAGATQVVDGAGSNPPSPQTTPAQADTKIERRRRWRRWWWWAVRKLARTHSHFKFVCGGEGVYDWEGGGEVIGQRQTRDIALQNHALLWIFSFLSFFVFFLLPYIRG